MVSLLVLSEHNVQTAVRLESPQSPVALRLTSPPIISSFLSLLFSPPFHLSIPSVPRAYTVIDSLTCSCVYVKSELWLSSILPKETDFRHYSRSGQVLWTHAHARWLATFSDDKSGVMVCCVISWILLWSSCFSQELISNRLYWSVPVSSPSCPPLCLELVWVQSCHGRVQAQLCVFLSTDLKSLLCSENVTWEMTFCISLGLFHTTFCYNVFVCVFFSRQVFGWWERSSMHRHWRSEQRCWVFTSALPRYTWTHCWSILKNVLQCQLNWSTLCAIDPS